MLIIIIIIAIIILWFFIQYNSFIHMRTRVEESLADIDIQLKRRYDLIPNLINTVKGYATHESNVFTKVTEARTQAMGGTHTSLSEKAGSENMLSGALKSLFAVSENYPELKANQNFLDLQNELTDTENKIQAARRFYNTTVKTLNIKIQQIPSNIVARIGNFNQKEFFDLDESSKERENIKVKF